MPWFAPFLFPLLLVLSPFLGLQKCLKWTFKRPLGLSVRVCVTLFDPSTPWKRGDHWPDLIFKTIHNKRTKEHHTTEQHKGSNIVLGARKWLKFIHWIRHPVICANWLVGWLSDWKEMKEGNSPLKILREGMSPSVLGQFSIVTSIFAHTLCTHTMCIYADICTYTMCIKARICTCTSLKKWRLADVGTLRKCSLGALWARSKFKWYHFAQHHSASQQASDRG